MPIHLWGLPRLAPCFTPQQAFNMKTQLPIFSAKTLLASALLIVGLAGATTQQAAAQMGAVPRISLSVGARALALSKDDETPTSGTFYGPSLLLHIQSGNVELGLGGHSALNEKGISDKNLSQTGLIQRHIIPTARLSVLLFRDAIFTPLAYVSGEFASAAIDINEGNSTGPNDGKFKQATGVVGLGARVRFSDWFVQADAGLGLSRLNIEGAPFTTREYKSVNAGDFALRLGYTFGRE